MATGHLKHMAGYVALVVCFLLFLEDFSGSVWKAVAQDSSEQAMQDRGAVLYYDFDSGAPAMESREMEGYRISVHKLARLKQFVFMAEVENVTKETRPEVACEILFHEASGKSLGAIHASIKSLDPGEKVEICETLDRDTLDFTEIYDWRLGLDEDNDGTYYFGARRPVTETSDEIKKRYIYVDNVTPGLYRSVSKSGISLTLNKINMHGQWVYYELGWKNNSLLVQEGDEYDIQIRLKDNEGKILGTFGQVLDYACLTGQKELTGGAEENQELIYAVAWDFEITKREKKDPAVTPTPVPAAASAAPVLPEPTRQPVRIEGLGVRRTDSGKAKIYWKKTTAQRILVYRSASKKGSYKKIGETSGRKNSYTDKNVKKGSTYYYKVLPDTAASLKTAAVLKIRIHYLATPAITIKKGQKKGDRYIEIRLKKYEGKYADIYVKRDHKFMKLKIKKKRITYYKGRYRFRYKEKHLTLHFKVRTWENRKGKKRSSAFSEIKMIRV